MRARTIAIAVDPVHKRIIWHDYKDSAIIYANFNGTNRKAIIRFESPFRVFSITVDPYQRQLYMSDRKHIMSVGLNGKNLRIMNKENTEPVRRLALDFRSG